MNRYLLYLLLCPLFLNISGALPILNQVVSPLESVAITKLESVAITNINTNTNINSVIIAMEDEVGILEADCGCSQETIAITKRDMGIVAGLIIGLCGIASLVLQFFPR